MRNLARLLVVAVPLTAACTDDTSDDTTTTVANTSAMGSDTGGPATDTGPAGTDSSGGGGGTGPVINSVSWTHAAGCVGGTSTDVTIVVDATGDSLTYTGMVIGCVGAIDGPMVTMSCPELSPYPGSLTVTDAGGMTADLDFEIAVCVDGSAP